MKKSIKLSLIGLFTLLTNATSYSAEEKYKAFNKTLETKHLQNPFFHEDHIENLEEARIAHEKEQGFLSRTGTKIRKTAQRIFYDDHRTIANAFNTTDIPSLNDSEKESFKNLKPQEQLEFCNEWLEKELETNVKFSKDLSDRYNNLMAIHNQKINKLNAEITRLEEEQKDFENPSWLRKKWHGEEGIKTKLEEIKNKITAKKEELEKETQSKEKSSNHLDNEDIKHTKTTKEKIEKFIKRINTDLGNNQLRYNTKTEKFELHNKTTDLTYKSENENSPETLYSFWQKVGNSDFTGSSTSTQNANQTAKDIDALQKQFETSIRLETTQIFPPKENLSKEETEQRNAIINEMSEALKNIFNEFKNKRIDLEEAKEQTNQVLEQAKEKGKLFDESSLISSQTENSRNKKDSVPNADEQEDTNNSSTNANTQYPKGNDSIFSQSDTNKDKKSDFDTVFAQFERNAANTPPSSNTRSIKKNADEQNDDTNSSSITNASGITSENQNTSMPSTKDTTLQSQKQKLQINIIPILTSNYEEYHELSKEINEAKTSSDIQRIETKINEKLKSETEKQQPVAPPSF